MKIKLVRLQNVKSYMDETITFNEGVNFISGVNGAGKTTIIESIGYALFNSKPGSTSEFLRYGQKSGIISVDFEANDNRLYRVVRKFGNTNSWLVFDMETNSEIDLHGSIDIVPFLREVLGMDADQDPSQLFDDVIGISQGTFTAPFLESAAGRRDKFNRIFKVESYRAAFHKILGVIKRLEEIMKSLEIQRAEKEGSIRDYKEVRQKLDDVGPVIIRLENEVSEKKSKRENAEKERNTLRDREKEMQKASKDIQVSGERIKGLDDSAVKLGENLKLAEASAGLVQQHLDGYTVYIRLKKEQELLEKQRNNRDGLKDRLAKNETAHGENKAAIETEKRAINLEKTDIDASNAEVSGIVEKAQNDMVRSKAELDRISGVKDENAKMQAALDGLEKRKNDAVKLNVKLRANSGKWTDIRKNIEKIEGELLNEAEMNVRMGLLKSLEEEKKAVEREKAAQQQKLENLKENLAKTAGGKCPFLDAPCLNVDDGLDVHFSGKITDQLKLLEDLGNKEVLLSEAVTGSEGVRKELLKLEDEKVNLKNLEHQEAKLALEFNNDFHLLAELLQGWQSGEIKAAAVLLDDKTHKFAVDAGCRALLKTLEEGFANLRNACEIFKITAAAANPLNLHKSLELLDYSENAVEKAESFLAAGKKLQDVYKAVIDGEYQARLSESVKAGRDVSNAHKRMEDLQARSKKLEIRIHGLVEAGQRLAVLTAQKNELEKLLSVFQGLDIKIGETQKCLEANQEAYDTYMKHQTEASKVGRLVDEIKKKEEMLLNEKEGLRMLQEKLALLSTGYSEDVLRQAEKLVEQLAGELAAVESELSERRSDLEELKASLELMEKVKNDIAKLDEKLAYYMNVRDITTFVRNILNRAGEKISAEYRKYLAGEANKIYREVSRENVVVEWRDDYEVFLVDVLNGRKRERCFRQLSGGEQMTAALAMRLGLLRQLSGVGVGFFDEPTTNLDGERRNNLAQIIPQVTGSFDQLFVISHDDSFDSMTENIVQLRKDSGEGTRLI